jgi:hypothetical protein
VLSESTSITIIRILTSGVIPRGVNWLMVYLTTAFIRYPAATHCVPGGCRAYIHVCIAPQKPKGGGRHCSNNNRSYCSCCSGGLLWTNKNPMRDSPMLRFYSSWWIIQPLRLPRRVERDLNEFFGSTVIIYIATIIMMILIKRNNAYRW